MNAELLNPFQAAHPTAIQTSLFSNALFARFDPSGKYLAAGRHDGSVAIWDVEIKNTVRWLDGHVKAISSIDWSRNSRYLLTSSKDWNVIIWDLTSEFDPPQRKTTLRFDAPVVSASFHPRNSQIVLALMGSGEAFISDLRPSRKERYELLEPTEEEDEDEDRRTGMTAAKFDPTGKLIFIGTTVGTILVFNSRTKRMIARHKVPGATVFKGFEFAKSGRRLVTNSSDRNLRQFNLPAYGPSNDEGSYIESELEPTHKFVEHINRTAWNAMSYSPDGNWLAGGAADPAGHRIYIYDMSNDGILATTLDGGREPLAHLQWHPSKSYIASTTKHGNILLWHKPTPERWGAFAGDFEEVDENVEYEEKENEFDIEDEADILARKRKEEDQEVDINTLPEVPDTRFRKVHLIGQQGDDEDFAWADDEQDDDTESWRMKLVLLDDDYI